MTSHRENFNNLKGLKTLNNIKKSTIYTLLLVYFLIFVGGFVRSSGAGMGCPDWPKCFGQWIPPTSSEELPENYRELFLQKRLKKVDRMVSILSFIGLTELSNSIKNDPNIEKEELFNSRKTWIEYTNRLVGVSVGVMSIILLFSARKRKFELKIAAWVLFLVVLEGLIGSLIVVTNLLPWVVSIHTLLALIILLLLTYLFFYLNKNKLELDLNDDISILKDENYNRIYHRRKNLKIHFILLIIFYIFQLFSGIWVREHIDALSFIPAIEKGEYLESIGLLFYIHRSFSILLLFYQLYILWKYYKVTRETKFNFSKTIKRNNLSNIRVLWVVFCTLTVIEIVFGAILYYFDLPFLVQPIHLLLSFILVNLVFYAYLCENVRGKILLSKP